MKILFFSFRGVLVDRELTETLIEAGHQVKILDFPELLKKENYLALLFSEITIYSPALILTTNSLGFDNQGLVADFLNSKRIPYATWELDHPFWGMLYNIRKIEPSEYYFQFIWDEGYLKDLLALGYKNVHHLPLGCYTKAFPDKSGSFGITYPYSFVGISSMEFFDKMFKQGIFNQDIASPFIKECYELVRKEIAKEPEKNIEEILLIKGQEVSGIPELIKEKDAFKKFIFFMEIFSGILYRKELILSFPELHVFGDNAWKLLGVNNLHPPLAYYDELSRVYTETAVNINITLLKNRWDLNQRIFDVPCAGGFLITDRRRNLEKYFKIGDEIETYSSKEELLSKSRFYNEHPEKRESFILKGRARVFKEHTIRHRVDSMLEILGKYGIL